jgi:antitoxin VapB
MYILAYILHDEMSERAKIFQNGGSQAVRLPKSCRFEDGQDEVIVRRVGRQVILEPADEWTPEFLACLGGWEDDIPRPSSRPVGASTNPFDGS